MENEGDPRRSVNPDSDMARLLNVNPDTDVEPHLEAHLTHLRKDNQRPRSIRERRLALLRVGRAIGHPVATVTKDELAAWQDARVTEITPAAIHTEIAHIARYLKWLHETERRPDNPSMALVRPRRLNQRLPRPISEPDLARALQLATDPTIHAWIALAADCGLRCMEIADLRADDIGQTSLRVVGKGDKERVVPLRRGVRDELTSGPFNRAGHLFSRIDGKPGPPSAMRVSEQLNDFLRHTVGIPDTAHSLRHRFGTQMYRLTRDPFKVASWMGHASTDTTRGYVLLATDDAVDFAEALGRLSAA